MAKKRKTIDISAKNFKLTLGTTLKTARKQKNLSIEDLHKFTKIPIDSIKNLETESWDKLPASAYIKGFIKSYAKYVDLNYNDLLDSYNNIVSEQKSNIVKKADFIHIKSSKPFNEDNQDNQESRVSMALIIFILVLIASLAVSYFSNQNDKNDAVSPSASEIVNIDVTG